MTDTPIRWCHALFAACVLWAIVLPTAAAPAGEGGEMGFQTVREEGEDVPTGARRAAEWEPSREGLVGEPWDFAVLAGFTFISGDDAFDDAGFAAELKLSRDLASDFYVAGSYLLAFVSTDVTDPDGSAVDETHTLHVPTLGVGYRAELSPEIHLFIEPKLGALITGDDVGPVGGFSTGVDIQVDPGILVRANFTALAVDAGVDTDAGDADLNALYSVGIGLVFEF